MICFVINQTIKIWIILILIILSFTGYGQNQKLIDSLVLILKSTKQDTSKVNFYISISQQYENFKLDSAIIYAEKGILIAEKIKFKKGIIACSNNLGNFYFKLGNYPKAVNSYQKAVKICEELSSSSDKEEADFGKTNIHKFYNNIGVVHQYMGNFQQAILYYQKALIVFEKINDKKGISLCFNNIGMVYYDMQEFDKAINFYEKSVKICEALGDEQGLSMCYNNLGLVYMNLENYTKVLDYYLKTLKIDIKLQDKEGEAAVLGNIAELYCKLKDYKKAIEYSKQSMIIAKEVGSLFCEKQAYCFLSDAYDSLHDYKKAFENHKLFKLLNDSIYNEESSRQIQEMEAKYQNEKKQLEIEKLGKEKELQVSENKKQKLIIFSVIGSLLIVIVFSIFLFRLFILKRKANILLAQQKEEIASQRDEIETQRDLVTQQKEHIEEIHQEVTDSIQYAKRIQKAVLPGDEYIKERLTGDFFILFKPKDIVSGDFYFVERKKNLIFIAVADCTGHGVPGAFMSMLGYAFLNEIIVKEDIVSVSIVLDQLRDYIIKALQQKGESGEQKDGMDIGFCAINIDTLEMQFAGANTPCWIVSSFKPEALPAGRQVLSFDNAEETNFKLHEVKPDKQPIGIHSNMHPFTNQKYQLQKGDTIYLMSDGFEDQFGGPNRKKFLAKNLKNLLTANSQLPLADQKQILETTISEWIGNGEQIDDITILGITI